MARATSKALVLAAAALLPVAAGATSFFPARSLIIPTQASFQDPCGMVSTYGLVYQILRAGVWLDGQTSNSNCPGGVCHRVTIHWVYRGDKKSPNRCVPTNLDVPPDGSLPNGNTAWNDGCDFHVTNNGGVPVQLINNSTGDLADDKPVVTNDTTQINTLTYPQYFSQTVAFDPARSGSLDACQTDPVAIAQGAPFGPGCNVTNVGYLGGAFVISAADAQIALNLINGKLAAKDPQGNAILYSQYNSNPSACNVNSVTGNFFWDTGNGMVNDGAAPFANVHQVNIHRAMSGFNADDQSRMNSTPARIALLKYAGGVGSVRSFVGNGVVGDMLPKYLKSAGLDFPGAGGCPNGSVNAGKKDADGNPLCPPAVNGNMHGQIYDAFDVLDLTAAADPLNNIVGVKDDKYSVAWLPHWEARVFTGCDATCIASAIKSLVRYSERNNGLLAECGSIAVLEGSTFDPTLDPFLPASQTFNYDSISSSPASANLTCQASTTSPGTCKTPVVNDVRGLSHHESGPFGRSSGNTGGMNNCTDPVASLNPLNDFGNCMHFPSPGDAFAQIGDYNWNEPAGLVSDYFPKAGEAYANGSNPLAYVLSNPNPTLLRSLAPSDARKLAIADQFTFMQRGNNKKKARVLYLGGHTYSNVVSGTRVALNTLLALGFQPTTQETSYTGPTPYGNVALVPTYEGLQDPAPPPTTSVNYTNGSNSLWEFPFHKGHLRAIQVNQLSAATVSYATAAPATSFPVADAAKVLAGTAPKDRNVFTYLGGQVKKGPALGSGRTAPNGVLQVGWQPVDIDTRSIGSGCLDVLKIGQVCSNAAAAARTCVGGAAESKKNYLGAPYAGMIDGPNGVCDIQEALALTVAPSDLGIDIGASEQTAIINKLKDKSAILDAQELLQMVRGFCYATTAPHTDGVGSLIVHPLDAQCNLGFDASSGSEDTRNKPILGALVRSMVVVVGPSVLVPDSPAGKVRPTVAYVGGWDGQLHAFYIPSSSTGSDVTGYAGPLMATANVALSPASTPPGLDSPVFHTPFGTPSSFAPPAPLTELWSFIPPGQLPYLRSNNARVDATPAVIDVFGDFTGSGSNSWHTVLVGSAGGTNRELFAVDVTNPLAPVLLWDHIATADPTLPYAPISLVDDETGSDILTANVWSNSCHLGDSTCTPAQFLLAPSSDPGRKTTGAYNFRHLGASQSVDVAALRKNNQPVYAAFVATNEPNGSGMAVFAIDIVTGQKLWEFANPYPIDHAAALLRGVGNNAPAGVTLASRSLTGIIDTVYVGDDMGRLWELNANDGRNLTSFAAPLNCIDGTCNYPLSDAFASGGNNAQPISTLPEIFYLPTTLTTGPVKTHVGELMLAYGTAGTDTAGAIATVPPVTGVIHLLSLAPSGRFQTPDFINAQGIANRATAKVVGTATELGPFKLPEGERLYGAIQAVGPDLVFSTTQGSVNSLDQRGPGSSLTGSTFHLPLGDTLPVPAAWLNNVGASGGSPLVYFYSGANMITPPGGGGTGGTTGTVNSLRILSVTDKGISVVDKPIDAAKIPQYPPPSGGNGPPTGIDLVRGAAGGQNGFLRLMGWFYRSLGRER